MNILENKIFSETRLSMLSQAFKEIEELKNNNLCVYTTGSYGRLEASQNSDVDLFFIDTDEYIPTTGIDRILINAEIIKICRGMKLPEFSKDGMYLSIHNLYAIKNELGSQSDDFKNYFTARMLLLLESKPIYNESLHTFCLEEIVQSYYVDFNDHSKSFEPIFLCNDIIRFWKTLCLNYEHKRKRKDLSDEDQKREKVVAHSKNLKLKFSRKLTCFSFILKLVDLDNPIHQSDVILISKMTPIERMFSLKSSNPTTAPKIQKAISTYEWFISKTQIPSSDMLDWISDRNERDEAFQKSREFGQQLFDILEEIDGKNILPKLLI